MENLSIVLLTVFSVTLMYQVKHFVADFVLQNKYMLGKFKPYPECMVPLSAHCLVHVLLLALLIIISLNDALNYWHLFGILVYEFLSHFLIDYVKAQYVAKNLLRADTHMSFWVAVGLDQLMHSIFSIPILMWWVIEMLFK